MKILLVIIAIFISSACVGSDVNTQGSATPGPTPVQERVDTGLQAELAKIAEAAKGTVGVGAVLAETGDAAWLERGGRFPMQSVYKVPIAMALLKMVDDGRFKIEQEISITPEDFVRQGLHSPIRNENPQGTVLPLSEVLRYSVAESDGTASDVLLDMAGGPAAVQDYLTGIGVTEVTVADSEKSISKDWETQYRNWATPQGAVSLLKAIGEGRTGLSEETNRLLIDIMTATVTGRDRLKAGLPEGFSLAHKTGTGGTRDGITGATNDIGIVTTPGGRHIYIAVFIRDSSADMATREKVMADITRAVTEKWGTK